LEHEVVEGVGSCTGILKTPVREGILGVEFAERGGFPTKVSGTEPVGDTDGT
jgi:hypothetical protein